MTSFRLKQATRAQLAVTLILTLSPSADPPDRCTQRLNQGKTADSTEMTESHSGVRRIPEESADVVAPASYATGGQTLGPEASPVHGGFKRELNVQA